MSYTRIPHDTPHRVDADGWTYYGEVWRWKVDSDTKLVTIAKKGASRWFELTALEEIGDDGPGPAVERVVAIWEAGYFEGRSDVGIEVRAAIGVLL